MNATSFVKAQCLQTIERYLPGARHAQRMLVATAGIVSLTFVIIGSGTGDEAWFFATLPLIAVLAFALVMLLRKVTYSIDPTTGSFLRIAQWGGYTLSERQLNAGEFETIRIGSFSGQTQILARHAGLVGNRADEIACGHSGLAADAEENLHHTGPTATTWA